MFLVVSALERGFSLTDTILSDSMTLVHEVRRKILLNETYTFHEIEVGFNHWS